MSNIKTSGKEPSILIAAAGTGGHIFPALTVAEVLKEKGYSITWVGTQTGLEAKLIPAAGFPFETLSVAGVRGKSIFNKFKLILLMLKACWQAYQLLRRYKPVLVLGFGGYVTAPMGLACLLTRTKLIIHEQNSVPGMSNKILAYWAAKICVSFPDTLPTKRTFYTGNPLRKAILAINKENLPSDEAALKILVLGGSLGAQAINEVIPRLLKIAGSDLIIIHQCGEKNLASTEAAYAKEGVVADVRPFIADMAQAYTWADVVIARAGATTVAELAAVGLPSILVPYPHAVDDHQTKNAVYLANAGAAVIMPQHTLNVESLSQEVDKFAKNRPYLKQMVAQARRLGQGNATENVVKVCEETLAKK